MTLFKTIKIKASDSSDLKLPISISKTRFLGFLIHTSKTFEVEENYDTHGFLNDPKFIKSF